MCEGIGVGMWKNNKTKKSKSKEDAFFYQILVIKINEKWNLEESEKLKNKFIKKLFHEWLAAVLYNNSILIW